MNFDLKNPDTHASGKADAIFRELRRSEPVYWHEEDDGPGFWCVTRYEDIVAVSKNPQTFGSALDLGGIHIDDSRSFEVNAGVNMIISDPPQHHAMRRVISPAFSPRRVRNLESIVDVHVDGLLDALDAGQEFDFVERVAAPLPIHVLATLLGAAPDDHGKLTLWSDQLVGYDDPEIRASEDAIRDSLQGMSMFALVLWLHAAKRDDESIVSMLARSKDEHGERMTMRDFVATFILMIVAGNETTRNAISGGLLALDAHDNQKQALREDPDLMSGAISEIVRWVTPVVYMRRTAKRDAEIGGRAVRAGDKIVLWYASANRDEDVFNEPYRFDIRRNGPAHLGFGSGTHFCIGSRVAEMEMRVLFSKLLARYPNISVAGRVDRLRSNFIHGIKRLPVKA